MNDPRAVTFLGSTDFRNQSTKFGIRAKDRLQHMYIIGKSGVGKSTLLENMMVQDIQNGNGCAFFDPHGKSAELMLQYIPEHRVDDVVYFAPFDTDNPISFNPLEHDDFTEQNQRNFIADSLLSAFKKIWGAEKFSDRMEYILSMTLLALLEYPESTLLGINRMYSDKEFRNKVIECITDVTVKSFWVQTFGTWDPKYAREATAAIENKIGQLSSNPLIRNIVGQPKSSFDFRQVIDGKKIFIANLSIGRIGEQNTSLLGAMLMSKLYLAAMSRADKSESEMVSLPPFYLYVDEFQNFANDSFENILSQARKYKLGLTVAHQYVDQMPEKLRFGILGNVGTMATFRIGPTDAELFEKQFSPIFTAQDFVNLAPYQVYLSLLIDGLGSKPFSAKTLPPIQKPSIDYSAHVIARSRQQFSNPRSGVESVIADWYSPIPTKKDIEHAAYLEKKKAEVTSAGGEWTPKSSARYSIEPVVEPIDPNKSMYPKGVYHQPPKPVQPKVEPTSRAVGDLLFNPKPIVPVRSAPVGVGATNPGVVPFKASSLAPQPVAVAPIATEPTKVSVSDAFADILEDLNFEKKQDAPVVVEPPQVQVPVVKKLTRGPVEELLYKQKTANENKVSEVIKKPLPPAPVVEKPKPVGKPVFIPKQSLPQSKPVTNPVLIKVPMPDKKPTQGGQKEPSVESVSRLKEVLDKVQKEKTDLPLPPPPPATFKPRLAVSKPSEQKKEEPALQKDEQQVTVSTQQSSITPSSVYDSIFAMKSKSSQDTSSKKSDTVSSREVSADDLAKILGVEIDV